MAKAALVSTDFVSATEIGENGHYTYGFIGKHGDSVPTEGILTIIPTMWTLITHPKDKGKLSDSSQVIPMYAILPTT